MFEFIRGTVVAVRENEVVVENNDIGYKILTSKNTLSDLSIGDIALINISFVVREDGVYLYGFSTKEEKDLFELLTTVSSIGPKNGLSILSTLTPVEVKMAILNDGIDTLSLSPGIGKKTASRICLELADKIEADFSSSPETNARIPLNDDEQIAIDALENLGYFRSDVVKIIKEMNVQEMGLDSIIKEAMRRMSRK